MCLPKHCFLYGKAALACALFASVAAAQQPAPAGISATATANHATQGGTISGTIVSGTPGKPGAVPLPGVAVTATNTLTGRRYSAATDINGHYAMTIPHNGRYVVRADLTGFATVTKEIVLNATPTGPAQQTADLGLELASRVAAAEARQERAAASSQQSGLQNLGLGTSSLTGVDASVGEGNTGVSMPSLAGIEGASNGEAAGSDAIAIAGQSGETNGLADFSEDEIREHIQEAVNRAQANGQIAGGPAATDAIVGMLGGMMMGGPGGGPGGHGGHFGHGGFGNFRGFNPAQPHGSVYWTGGNNAWDSAPWLPTLVPVAEPAGYQNNYGVDFIGSPYIPGLIKPDTRQFVFINLNGQKDLNAFTANGRVPTAAERAGDFSNSYQEGAKGLQPVQLYDPATGLPIPGENLANAAPAATPAEAQARAEAQQLLAYYPLPNINTTSTDPSVYNYQTVTNAGDNSVSLNTRYIRNFGQNANQPFGGFGRFGRSSGPPSLRQNMNAAFNYSHSAEDLRNIFLGLGGASESNGYNLNTGYTIGYGRFSSHTTVTWNRSFAETRNYFTDTSNDPTASIFGGSIPNQTSNFADPHFYNGLPTIQLTNFESLTNQAPSEAINQVVAFSEFVSWRHDKHNLRLGFDVRRVHADSIGGSNPLGSFSFTGFATESSQDQTASESPTSTTQPSTGSSFADFLLGLPTQTSIDAGLYKFYLRQNVIDGYATDDWRAAHSFTLNYGVRWEYFSPYVEKNNRMVNLDHNADFSVVDPVQPGATGTYEGAFPRSLVYPDRTMFAPRLGFAYRLPDHGLMHETVLRGGYGINYNTTQYQTFAKQLTYQPPFAATQTNVLPSTSNPSTCTTEIAGSTPTMTLANGFGCSTKAIQNDYAVDKNYRLGMVQVYNLNLQRTIPLGIVLNLGYSGSKGSNLDVVGDPNLSATSPALISQNAQSFLYETSVAGSHFNSLVASAQMRQHKGISLSAIYTYGHSIDNASSIGGSGASTVQNFHRLDLEEGNSTFDRRQKLTGNWLIELPFGPNRAFLNQGGFWSHALDGFGFSGSYTFASGSYYTPEYENSVAEELYGGYYTQRPDRVFSESIHGPGTLQEFFNKAAFTVPAAGYGTASRDSIEGPGTVSVNAALSRVIQLGDTRSFEMRLTGSNVFNTVQYSGINTTENSPQFGQVTSAASMRAISVLARYRF